MPFFMIKDELQGNAKAQALLRSPLSGDKDGPAAFGLWSAAGSVSQAKGSDGVVTEEDLISLILHRPSVRRWAKRLVDVGLWHTAGHDCVRCPSVPAGSYLFHDWFDNGKYKTGKAYETQRRKSRELTLSHLRDAVWERDCTDNPAEPKVGKCRYCGTEVLRSDRKSPRRPTMDHVDPEKAEGLSNLVLCCEVCNKKKARKTPEEAGMKLLPPPLKAPESSGESKSESNQNQIRIKPESTDLPHQNQTQNVSPRADAHGTHTRATGAQHARPHGGAGQGGEPKALESSLQP